MNSFEDFLVECTDVEVVGDTDALDLHVPANRDGLNFAILDIVDSTQDARLVYQQLSVVMDAVGYHLPDADDFPELRQEEGEILIGLQGTNDLYPCALYLAFTEDEVFAEIVTDEELQEITDVNTDVESI